MTNLDKLVGYRYNLTEPAVQLIFENGATQTVTEFKDDEGELTIHEYCANLLTKLFERCGTDVMYTDELAFNGYVFTSQSAVLICKEPPKVRNYIGESRIDVIFTYGETELTLTIGSELELDNAKNIFGSQLRMFQTKNV